MIIIDSALMKMIPNTHSLSAAVVCAALLSLAMPAQAQWQWRDESGRRVFSDRPPPPSVPEAVIVSRPRADKRQPAADTQVSANSQPVSPRAPVAGARSEADLKAEAELQKKVKADEARVTAQRADNCQRAQRSLITVNSGMRIATVNDKGEREFMDEKALAGERQRLESIIRSDCAPG